MKCSFLVLSLFITLLLQAQDSIRFKKDISKYGTNNTRPTQAVFAELGGSAFFLSVNYDRRFKKRNTGLGFRTGIGNGFSSTPGFFSLPLSINYLLGKKSGFFEIGFGETPMFVYAGSKDYTVGIGNINLHAGDHVLLTNMNLGYRLQPVRGGFNFRVGVMPFLIKREASVFPYLSCGYNF